MKLVKVAASALNQTPFDWRHNKENILAAIERARAAGAAVLCLPEMCITGYGCEDMFHSPNLQRHALAALEEIAAATAGMVVSVGLPLLYHNGLFNAAAMLVDGRIAGFAAKKFLAGDGIHYEPRWFKPWPQGVCRHVTVGGASYPVGDIYFDIGGVKFGFEICEDAWVAARPGAALSLKGVDIIMNPSASHFAFGKLEVRKRFVQEGSRAFGVTYIYSNLLGNESGRAIYDGGPLIASAGKLLAVGPRFSFAERVLVEAVIDVDLTRMSQSRTASFEPNLEEEPTDCVAVKFQWPAVGPAAEPAVQDRWEASARLKEEEFTRAVSLALYDYLRKSRSSGFVVSLSGGGDSRFLAGLTAARLPAGSATAADITRALLTCVYQATENSSDTTRAAARTVAGAIGAEFLEFDVDGLAKSYVGMVANAIGRQLSW
jgi:NAD+ synthase (glutamine-hydrolysing)